MAKIDTLVLRYYVLIGVTVQDNICVYLVESTHFDEEKQGVSLVYSMPPCLAVSLEEVGWNNHKANSSRSRRL